MIFGLLTAISPPRICSTQYSYKLKLNVFGLSNGEKRFRRFLTQIATIFERYDCCISLGPKVWCDIFLGCFGVLVFFLHQRYGARVYVLFVSYIRLEMSAFGQIDLPH